VTRFYLGHPKATGFDLDHPKPTRFDLGHPKVSRFDLDHPKATLILLLLSLWQNINMKRKPTSFFLFFLGVSKASLDGHKITPTYKVKEERTKICR
jgi:hypothetical protein